MKRTSLILLIAILLISTFIFAGCGDKQKPVVNISIWTNPENEELLKSELEEFKELHKDEAEFVFTVSFEDEDTCKSTVLASPENAADIFAFADDQLDELYSNNCLLEITLNTEDIYNSVGGHTSAAADAITRDGKIYAYPLTAGNGYFLYYNKAYYTEEDVKSLDKILEIAASNGKKFTMDLSSGWYLYSFFRGAGFTLYNDNGTNVCDWNQTGDMFSGVQVTESILNMANNSGFVSLNDDGFKEGIRSGEVIAGINGPWNAENVAASWGDNYAATMLPSYFIGDKSVPMYNFMGYKLIGINAYTKEADWCMVLAEFLTNETNQLRRFASTGECPANINASTNADIQASPAIAALNMQSEYSSRQSVADPYWDASQKFGIILSAGNKDNKDLQELLDDLVKEVTGQ